ncbi:MAG: hypothetical protein ACREXY_01625 [Gammaproteobacteria bacterium]
MKVYSAIIERDPHTEVIAMLLEDGDPHLESEFIGVQNVAVA